MDLIQLFKEMEETFEKAFKVVNELKAECDYMIKCENNKKDLYLYQMEEIEIENKIDELKYKLLINKEEQNVARNKIKENREKERILTYLKTFD